MTPPSAAGDTLVIRLEPDRLLVEPGSSPVECLMTLQNRGDVVDQYTVELSGIDSDWFTLELSSVGLFPGDSVPVHITFHPPKRAGMRAGAFPFQVRVRSRGGATAEVAEGVLDVRGTAVYRLDLVPRRQTARRRGRFQLELRNSGTADVLLGLEAKDAEEACRFGFRGGDRTQVAAGSTKQVPVVVKPRRRPWVGSDRSYDFGITVKPVEARGEAQTLSGQYTYQPWLPSWKPIRAIAWVLLVVVAAVVALNFAVSSGVGGEFAGRAQSARGVVCGSIRGLPLLGGLCPGPLPRPPSTPGSCRFEFGFRDIATRETGRIGNCTTNAAYDGFGNGIQYTTKGVLFWLKASNTVYFMMNDSLYVYAGGQMKLLDGSGSQ